MPPHPDLDYRVRMAAFEFLEEQTQLRGEVLPREVLAEGFAFDGQRVPLIGPQGIFKPALRPIRKFLEKRYGMFRKAG